MSEIKVDNPNSGEVENYFYHKVMKDDDTSSLTVYQCARCGTVYEEDDTALMCCVDFSKMSYKIIEELWIEPDVAAS